MKKKTITEEQVLFFMEAGLLGLENYIVIFFAAQLLVQAKHLDIAQHLSFF